MRHLAHAPCRWLPDKEKGPPARVPTSPWPTPLAIRTFSLRSSDIGPPLARPGGPPTGTHGNEYQVRLLLRRRQGGRPLGNARPPRRQGGQPPRNDQHRPARPGRLHPQHRRLHLLLPERAQIPAGDARSGRRRPAAHRKEHGREARRHDQSAAPVLPLRRPRVDAGHDGHRAEPRPQRRDRQGVGQADRQRALRAGLLPPALAHVRRGRHGPQGPPRRAVRAHP